MKKVNLIIVFVVLFGFSVIILFSTREVNKYWRSQSEITHIDSVNLEVPETKYLRGYLSFNQAYYIIDGKLDLSSIELWQVVELKLPFHIVKTSNSDTLWLYESEKSYIFILEQESLNTEY